MAASATIQAKAMSSLVKEDLSKKLFKSLGQRLHEFIEVECPGPHRFYLCVSGKWDRASGKLRLASPDFSYPSWVTVRAKFKLGFGYLWFNLDMG